MSARSCLSLLLAMAAGALAGAPAARAAYPERPITMIVAYGADGSTDVTARTLAPVLARHLGNGARIEIVNRPGAGGEIGFAALADAVPDGYTIGFINTPNLLTIPIERQARFAPGRIDPLVNVVDDPGVMTVHADTPYRTLAELVGQAGASPENITVGTTGVGSDDHLGMLFLQGLTRARFSHRPFPGSAEVYRAMLNRHIVVCAQNMGEALRGRSAGDPIRILGVMGAERSPAAPEIPTFREQGYDIVMGSMRGVGAPRGLPPAIRSALVKALAAAVADPEFQERARATHQPLRILGPEAFAAEIGQLDQEFRSLWRVQPWLK